MPTPHTLERVINHRRMRRLVGYTAFFLPPIVVFLSGRDELPSISISYWTDSQDVFVGSLFAVGFFLAAYNGTGNGGRWEKFLSRSACAFAILVALFPTTGFDPDRDVPPSWVFFLADHAGLTTDVIHGVSAVSLFVCLFFMLLVFSFRASRKDKPLRSMIYLIFGLAMLFGLPILFVLLEFVLCRNDTVFFVEWAGLWLFGCGWFLAGTYRIDREDFPTAIKELTSSPIEVDPCIKNFPTEILMHPGRRYYFTAEGCWKDWFLHCGPDGWGPKWNLLARKNRIPSEPFFALCGNIGMSTDEDLNFAIGSQGSWLAPARSANIEDHELYLYANDRPEKYGNNRALSQKAGGPLRVRVYELLSGPTL